MNFTLKLILSSLLAGSIDSKALCTSCALKQQMSVSTRESKIRHFHLEIRHFAAEGESRGSLGQFTSFTVVNQTPFPFTFNGGEGYDVNVTSTVWYHGGASGLQKQQCTVQLTIFADGVPHVKSLLIFHGKGPRIPQACDIQVVVKFQENARCDD